jgi:hypothetical protein
VLLKVTDQSLSKGIAARFVVMIAVWLKFPAGNFTSIEYLGGIAFLSD